MCQLNLASKSTQAAPVMGFGLNLSEGTGPTSRDDGSTKSGAFASGFAEIRICLRLWSHMQCLHGATRYAFAYGWWTRRPRRWVTAE